MSTLKVQNLTKTFELSDQEKRIQDTKAKSKVAVGNISFEIHSEVHYHLV